MALTSAIIRAAFLSFLSCCCPALPLAALGVAASKISSNLNNHTDMQQTSYVNVLPFFMLVTRLG